MSLESFKGGMIYHSAEAGRRMSTGDQKVALSVVVPAYNEARRIESSLATLLAFAQSLPGGCEIIVVDDGSTDDTVARVERLAQPTLRLIRNDHRGKGYAVRTGMLAARGAVVLFCDAALATPITEWHRFAPLFSRGATVVIGSRQAADSVVRDQPMLRYVMGRTFNWLIQRLAFAGIEDTQCGFKAFRGDVAQTVFSRLHLYGDRAKILRHPAVTAFDVEVLFVARRLGYRIEEVPVEWTYGTNTKVSPVRDSLRNLSDILRVRWLASRGTYDDSAGPS